MAGVGSAMSGSDLEEAHVFIGVHVFGIAPMCIRYTCVSVRVALECVHSHVCLPVLVSLHVMHTWAHCWGAHKPPV